MTLYRLRCLTEPIRFGLGRGVSTIGRSSDNTVQIPDSSISGRHCEIEVGDHGVVIRDLQSTNGTFVNDQPITEAGVPPGATVQFGTLRFLLEEEIVQIAIPSTGAAPEEPAAPATLPDGTLACSKFPHLPAAFRCSKCARNFHGSALRQVRLHSGKLPLLFCPDCDGKCEIIPGFTQMGKQDGVGGLISRITETIRLGWKKPK
jgi:hypothetical protein